MSLGQNDNAILKLLADEQLRKENAALAAENERLKSTIEAIYRIEPLLKEAVDSAWLAAKKGRDAK